MKPTLFNLAFLGATVAQISSMNRVMNLSGGVPNQFIVEFSDASDIPFKRELLHEGLYTSLRERKVSFDVQREFNFPGIFVGVALTLIDAQDVANILDADGVIAIRPIRTYPAPFPISLRTGISPDDPNLPDTESTHIQTGVDRLHALGITGKGIKVGVIDSGVDYTHPSLGGGFGAGFKIAGGIDFVGDAYNGSNTPMPDSDPQDCLGHGTHVTGILGANSGNIYNISGVAYDATIFAYRVFGCTGTVTEDIVIDAMLAAVKDEVDILTLSIDGVDGWTEAMVSVVASRIAASGKIVTISAGDDGASGAWFSSHPANAIDAFSVASSDSTRLPLQSLTASAANFTRIIVYYDLFPLPVFGSLPLYATSNDTTIPDDACNPLPASTPDLSKFVVLVRRGTCTFATKLANIAAFGGNATLFYDNGIGFAAIQGGNFSAVLIQAADGVFLGEQLAAGVSVNVTFPQTGGVLNFPEPAGGLVSAFSSYGPTNDMFLKPQITAPGGNILSTFPVSLGSWAIDSGTSMSAPFMAGVSALLFSVKGTSADVARRARTLFESTALPLASSQADGAPLQSASQQGAGLVQAYDALFATTILSQAELLLNDTAHFSGVQKFIVTNTGKTGKRYTLSHVPAGTSVTVDPDTGFVVNGPVPLSTDYASVTFNADKFTLAPGQSHEAVATIMPPQADAGTFPVYSGFVYVTGDDNETVHATYLGVAASLKNKTVVDNTDLIFGFPLPAILDVQGNVQDGPVNYTLVADDAPTVLWRQSFGTPVVRLDLVSADISFNGTSSSREVPFLSFTYSPSASGGTFVKVPIVGTLLEMDWLGRNDEFVDPDNTFLLSNSFANGTGIPDGSYKVLLRSLRVTGDPANEEDYESWLSPIIGVNAGQ